MKNIISFSIPQSNNEKKKKKIKKKENCLKDAKEKL